MGEIHETKGAAGKGGRSTAAKSTLGAAEPALLAGGNPQIAKADGDAPVQAYIAAMPGWKSDVGLRLDTLIERTVPGVRKAVKWNSPFYGIEARRCDPFHPAARPRTRAGSTSTRTISTRRRWRRGSGRRPLCPAGVRRRRRAPVTVSAPSGCAAPAAPVWG